MIAGKPRNVGAGHAKVVPSRKGQNMLDDMDKLVSLCKRRGFIFPSSEVYGGINGFWDYGPLGVELKRNIKEAWWRDNVQMRDDMVGLDCSIIMNPRVWEASGHVGGFSDPMVDCRATKERYRADQLYVFAYIFPAVNHKGEPTEAWLAGLGSSPEEAAVGPEKKAAKLAKRFGKPAEAPAVIPYLQLAVADREKVIGPSTDDRGTLTEPRAFNLMFKTFVGALESETNVAYLRPETAQGIFANFKNVVDTGRVQASVRNRADRQELSQRDQSAQLHVPLARVRADGDRVFLSSRRGQRMVRLLAADRGFSGMWISGCGPTGSGCATMTAKSWRFIRPRRPTSSTRFPSGRASSKGSRTGVTTTLAST